MYPVGLSVSDYKLSCEEFYKMKESGIDAIEICMSDMHMDEVPFKELKKYSKESGVRLWSFHLPFSPFEKIDISSKNEEKRKYSVEVQTELIKKAADVGINKFVIHPSVEPIKDNRRNDKLNRCMMSLDTLAEIAWREGGDICVEDLPRTCLGNSGAEMKTLLSANDKLKVCFDTNHLLGESSIEFFSNVASKVVTLHVSDYDFIDEKHWLPGEGRTDWDTLIKRLKDANYKGVWLYEVDMTAPDTIKRERDLTYKDFYDNACALFAGKKPPFLGVPVK